MGLFFNNKIFSSPFNESKNNKSNKQNNGITKTIKNFIVKANGLLKGENDSREYGSYPETNLDEIRLAIEHDSYAKQSIMKYSYLLFKAGYQIKSDNDEAAKYIEQRFHLMSFATKKPFDILLQETGDDLIKYSNAFLVKSRGDIPSNIINAKGYCADKPVVGYFRVDPTCMTIVRDKFGNIQKYVQHVENQKKEFKPQDVIHFYMDKEAKNAFGTPRMTAALEDIKILRKIEGNVMAMIYRFSMPLFQWIVGLPQEGYQATNPEIEETKNLVNNLPVDGSVVTNEKTSVKVIGAEGNALDATNYLSYFEKRVFAALDLSEAQMGRGGNNNADTMESQVHNVVKYFQRILSIFINNCIIDELLLEGGFNPITNPEDEAKLVFNEIDVDTRVKVENHEMAKYQANMTTFDEMRKSIGLKNTDNVDELYKNKIDKPYEKDIINAKTKSSIDILKANPNNNSNTNTNSNSNTNSNTNTKSIGNKPVSPNGNGTVSNNKNKDIENKNMPSNQYGKTSVKIKESLIETDVKKHKKKFKNFYDLYNDLKREVIRDPNSRETIFVLYKEKFEEAFNKEIATYTENAILIAKKEIKNIVGNNRNESTINYSLDAFNVQLKQDISKLFNDINNKLKTETDIESVFNAFEYRLRFMLEFIPQKAYWYAYLKTGQSYGFKKAHVKFNSEKDKKQFNEIIILNDIKYENIPPFHPFCQCEVYFRKGDD